MNYFSKMEVYLTEMVKNANRELAEYMISFPTFTDLGFDLSTELGYYKLISIIFGVFILITFVLMKSFPKYTDGISDMPGLSKIKSITTLTYGQFAISYTITMVLLLIFVGKYNADFIKHAFEGKPAESMTQNVVDITIAPYEGIRFGNGYSEKVDGEILHKDSIYNGTTSKKVLEQKYGNVICNYNGITSFKEKILDKDFKDSKDYFECEYPDQGNTMIVAKAYKQAGNSSLFNTVPIYISNDYDGVVNANGNMSQKMLLRNTNSSRQSALKQNKDHSIISVMTKADVYAVEEKYESYSDFIDINLNFLEAVNNYVLSKEETSDFAGKVRSSMNDLLIRETKLIKALKEIDSIEITEKNKSLVESKIKNLETLRNNLMGPDSKYNYYLDKALYFANVVSNNTEQKEIALNKYLDKKELKKKTDVSFKEVREVTDKPFIYYSVIYSMKRDSGSLGFSDIIMNIKNGFKNSDGDIDKEKLKLTINSLESDMIKRLSGKSFTEYNKLIANYKINDKTDGIFTDGGFDEAETRLNKSLELIYKETIDIFYKGGKSNSELIKEIRENSITRQDKRVLSEAILKDDVFNVLFGKGVFKDYENKILKDPAYLFYSCHTDYGILGNLKCQLTGELGDKNFMDEIYSKVLNRGQRTDVYRDKRDGFFNFAEDFVKAYSSYVQSIETAKNGNGTKKDLVYKTRLKVSEYQKLEKFDGEFSTFYGQDLIDIYNISHYDGSGLVPTYNISKKGDEQGGVWNWQTILDKDTGGVLGKSYDLVSGLLGVEGDLDTRFVSSGLTGKGIEVGVGDIIFANPGTIIYAKPYPITLRMPEELAKTIEVIDLDGNLKGTYSMKFSNSDLLGREGEKELVSRGGYFETGVVHTNGIYGAISALMTGGNVNWFFNPVTGIGVVDEGVGNIFYVLAYVFFASIGGLFIFRELFMGLFLLLFGTILIWLIFLNIGKRVIYKGVALYLSFVMLPIYILIMSGLTYWIFGNDVLSLSLVRNFQTINTVILLGLIVYIPIYFMIVTYKVFRAMLLGEKVDFNVMKIGLPTTEDFRNLALEIAGKVNPVANAANTVLKKTKKFGNGVAGSAKDTKDKESSANELLIGSTNNVQKKSIYDNTNKEKDKKLIKPGHKKVLFEKKEEDSKHSKPRKIKIEEESINGIKTSEIAKVKNYSNGKDLSEKDKELIIEAFGKKNVNSIAGITAILDSISKGNDNRIAGIDNKKLNLEDTKLQKEIEEQYKGDIKTGINEELTKTKKILEETQSKEAFEKIASLNKLSENSKSSVEEQFKNMSGIIDNIFSGVEHGEYKVISSMIQLANNGQLNNIELEKLLTMNGITDSGKYKKIADSINSLDSNSLEIIRKISNEKNKNKEDSFNTLVSILNGNNEAKELRKNDELSYLIAKQEAESIKDLEHSEKLALIVGSSYNDSVRTVNELNEFNRQKEKLINSISNSFESNGYLDENLISGSIKDLELSKTEKINLKKDLEKKFNSLKD